MKGCTYMACVYSKPEDADTNKSIINTLKKNTWELNRTGDVIITGDFNAKIPHLTGDRHAQRQNG